MNGTICSGMFCQLFCTPQDGKARFNALIHLEFNVKPYAMMSWYIQLRARWSISCRCVIITISDNPNMMIEVAIHIIRTFCKLSVAMGFHLWSSSDLLFRNTPGFSGVHIAQSLICYAVLSFCFVFLLIISLSVILWFTPSYPLVSSNLSYSVKHCKYKL